MCGCLSCAPYRGPGLQPRHVPYTGNPTGDPLVHRPACNPLSHTSQALRAFKLADVCLQFWALLSHCVLRRLLYTTVFTVAFWETTALCCSHGRICSKDTERLKVEGWEDICHGTESQSSRCCYHQEKGRK